jgi:hypothetical protein
MGSPESDQKDGSELLYQGGGRAAIATADHCEACLVAEIVPQCGHASGWIHMQLQDPCGNAGSRLVDGREVLASAVVVIGLQSSAVGWFATARRMGTRGTIVARLKGQMPVIADTEHEIGAGNHNRRKRRYCSN